MHDAVVAEAADLQTPVEEVSTRDSAACYSVWRAHPEYVGSNIAPCSLASSPRWVDPPKMKDPREELPVVGIEEFVLHEPVGTQLDILASSMSGVSNTAVGFVAARAGAPAVLVAPPTAPCETCKKKGMPDRTSEILAKDRAP